MLSFFLVKLFGGGNRHVIEKPRKSTADILPFYVSFRALIFAGSYRSRPSFTDPSVVSRKRVAVKSKARLKNAFQVVGGYLFFEFARGKKLASAPLFGVVFRALLGNGERVNGVGLYPRDFLRFLYLRSTAIRASGGDFVGGNNYFRAAVVTTHGNRVIPFFRRGKGFFYRYLLDFFVLFEVDSSAAIFAVKSLRGGVESHVAAARGTLDYLALLFRFLKAFKAAVV